MKTFASAARRSPAHAAANSPRSDKAAVRQILHAPRPQAKLAVGAPDDAFEKEADQVADHVMRMPEPGVQRMCSECEEELQAKAEPGETPSVPEEFESRFAALQGGGRPLPGSERAFFEPRFGRDFSHVRLHSGPAAGELARSVHARAFTLGDSIVLGAGEGGRHLLAHELTHTVQQGAAGTLRRKPRWPEDDPIHQPIIEKYRREEGLPESGIDPLTGNTVGPSPGAIKYGPWPGDVAAPASAPALTAQPEAMPLASCGTVTPGMDPAVATPIRDCITHSRFVNFMSQSIANMAKVASPYAPGIAAMYQLAFAEVMKAGVAARPTASAARSYTVSNATVTVTSGITLPVASFELKLFRQVGGTNGVAFGSGIELNEESKAVLLQDQADIERTMYHEGFHWLSGIVSSNNRSVRAGGTGTIVREELDYEFVKGFETELRAAAEPIWKDILATVPLKMSLPKPLTPQALSGIQWIKISNEILSRVEEAVYMSLRQGQGFSRRFDLPALQQDWLVTSDYWDSGVIFVRSDLQTFLSTNKGRVNRELLPVVQKIQREYLRRRPK